MDNYSKCDFKEYHETVMETKKAWLLDIVDDEKRWFPKSICELDREAQWLIIPQWLSDKIWKKIKVSKRVPKYLDMSPELDVDSFMIHMSFIK